MNNSDVMKASLRRAATSRPAQVQVIYLVSTADIQQQDLLCISLAVQSSRSLPRSRLPNSAPILVSFFFYLDRHAVEMTDTYHLKLEDAFDQADAEFGIGQAEWTASPRVSVSCRCSPLSLRLRVATGFDAPDRTWPSS